MGIVTGFLFLVLGAAAMYAGISAIRRNRRFRAWPETRARLVRSDVVSYRGPGADPGDVTGAVEYEYTVAGTTHRSRRIYVYGQSAWGGIGAGGRAARFLRGLHDGVPARYDPENPEDAALLPLPGRWVALLLAGALTLLLASVAAFAIV